MKPNMSDPKFVTDLMTFYIIMQKGSITEAANYFNVNKSIVSKRLTRLENSLQMQIVHRSTKGLTLTDEGQVILSHCDKLYEHLEQLLENVDKNSDVISGTITLACPSSFAQLHLNNAVSAFLKIYPEVKIKLFLGAKHMNREINEFDLTIKIGKLEDSSYKARKLSRYRMLVCGSPEYFKNNSIPKVPQDLLDHNCLLHATSLMGEQWKFTSPQGEKITVPVSGNFSASSSLALENAAVSGIGLIMIPGYMTSHFIKQGLLVSVLEEYCPYDIDIHILYPNTTYLAKKIRLFIDFLVARFQPALQTNKTETY